MKQPSSPQLIATIVRSAEVFILLLGYFTGIQIIRTIGSSAEHMTGGDAIGQYPLLVILIVHIILLGAADRSIFYKRAIFLFIFAISTTVFVTLVF